MLTAKIHQVNYYAVQRILRDEENLSQFLALYTIYQSDRLEKLNSDSLASETPNSTNPQINTQKTPKIVPPSTKAPQIAEKLEVESNLNAQKCKTPAELLYDFCYKAYLDNESISGGQLALMATQAGLGGINFRTGKKGKLSRTTSGKILKKIKLASKRIDS